ncbi:MAG: ester cyclase [Holophagaceae bacterium]
MNPESCRASVRRLVQEGQERGDPAVVDELLAPDFVDHRPLPGLSPDRAGVKALFAGLHAAFPDLRVTIEDQVVEPDGVATRKTFRGTHLGPFLGVPATGRAVVFEVIDILRFREGRISDHWVVVDRLDLLGQLGVLPPGLG